MFENFYCSGEWWIPQNPEKRLPGILSYNNEKGFILKLFGVLDNGHHIDNYKHPSIIIGLTKEHGEITLFQCILNNQPSRGMRISGGFWSQITESNYNPQYVFLGFCFQKKEEIQFKKVYITYTNFAEWVDISGFILPRLPRDGPFNMTYKKPDNIKIKLNDKCNLTIHFASHYPTWDFVQKDVYCEQETSLLVEFDEMTSFEIFLKYLKILKIFCLLL